MCLALAALAAVAYALNALASLAVADSLNALNALAAVAVHRSMPERPILPTRSTVTSRGIDCVLWTWSVRQPKGTVVVYHGLGAHARFPSVRLVAELLAARGYRVSAMDLPGHGESPGLRGYIESADALVVDGIRAATAAAFVERPTRPRAAG